MFAHRAPSPVLTPPQHPLGSFGDRPGYRPVPVRQVHRVLLRSHQHWPMFDRRSARRYPPRPVRAYRRTFLRGMAVQDCRPALHQTPRRPRGAEHGRATQANFADRYGGGVQRLSRSILRGMRCIRRLTRCRIDLRLTLRFQHTNTSSSCGNGCPRRPLFSSWSRRRWL